jgi:integrase
MAGHVRRRGPGRWQVRYYDPSGEERTKTFDRKVDADRFLSSVQVQLAQGDWADPRLGRTTFKEWSEDWLRTTVHYKPKTRAGIESLLKIHLLPAFGSHPLGRITQMHVRSWVAEASGRMSAARLRQAYWLLSKILGTAVEVGYLAKTPCVGVKLPRIPKREMRFLTADQVMALAQGVDPRYRTMVLVLVYGGLRWGECCALRRKRVDVLRGRLEVAESLAEIGGHLYFGETKTYRRRNVTLPGFLRTLLAEQLSMVGADPDALVFTAPEGGPLRAENFRGRVWMPALAAAGIPAGLRVHDYADGRVMPTSARNPLQGHVIALRSSA